VIHNQSGEIGNPVLRLLWRRTGYLRSAVAPLLPLKWRGQFFRLIARNQDVAKPKERLSPELQAMLTAELRDDILTLQDLIGRDLSVWLARMT